VQTPLAQSLGTEHVLVPAQRVGHVVVEPPQSTSVSSPFFVSVLQLSAPTQPLGALPQVSPRSEHVSGVQPHAKSMPPPPHVSGDVQS
jgi:hypothetical protein